jgi:ubiquinone/menaquinone biosynthesis C-methylase UbiE
MSADGSAAATRPSIAPEHIPDYLSKTYTWAYLSPRTMPWLDRPAVVSAILWGNADRLMRDSIAQFEPGQRVLQAACVYGRYTPLLARRLGESGTLTVTDVATVQLDNLAPKVAGLPQVRLHRGDLSRGQTGVAPGSQDAVACFFLLHEVPPAERRGIVGALLGAVRVGGRVVFTDYHRMRYWHPLRPIMSLVFHTLEPFANSLLDQSVGSISPLGQHFHFSQRTSFGGLYQQVIATRLA